MTVICLVWTAHNWASSKSETIYASHASWRAPKVLYWNQKSVLYFAVISLTRHWKGNLLSRFFADFWYWHIWQSATVPGLYHPLWGFWSSLGEVIPLSPAAFDFSFLLAAAIFFFLKASLYAGVGCPLLAKDATAWLLVVCLVHTISEM